MKLVSMSIAFYYSQMISMRGMIFPERLFWRILYATPGPGYAQLNNTERDKDYVSKSTLPQNEHNYVLYQ